MTTTRRCTCAGTAPGYPQHESYCGQPEPDDDDNGDPGGDWIEDEFERARQRRENPAHPRLTITKPPMSSRLVPAIPVDQTP